MRPATDGLSHFHRNKRREQRDFVSLSRCADSIQDTRDAQLWKSAAFRHERVDENDGPDRVRRFSAMRYDAAAIGKTNQDKIAQPFPFNRVGKCRVPRSIFSFSRCERSSNPVSVCVHFVRTLSKRVKNLEAAEALPVFRLSPVRHWEKAVLLSSYM